MSKDLLKNVAADRMIKEMVGKFSQHQQNYFLAGKTIGTSTYWINDFHPTALNFAAYLSPQVALAEQERLFQQMIKELEQVARKMQKKALITYDYAPQLVFNTLAKDNGFHLIRTTVMPKMPLSSALDQTKAIKIASDFELISLTALKKCPEQLAELTRQSYADYQENHRANPVADLSLEKWQEVIYADQLLDAPLVLRVKNQLAAYCFTFEDHPHELTWGWMGAVKPELLDFLQQRQLSWAQAKYQTLTGEFDSTDKLATRTYRNYAFELCPVYETYLKNV